MKFDTLSIEILADGTIKTEADKVSLPNHASAEAFLKGIAELGGGLTTRKAKHKKTHATTHAHNEHTHTH